MPPRKIQFVNSGVYHIFNKTIQRQLVFTNSAINTRFFESIRYYRSSKVRISFSRYKYLNEQLQKPIQEEIQDTKHYMINVLAYCLMFNHFHLLIEQKQEGGVSYFMSKLINSFTRYHNKRSKRIGPLFLPRFKAVEVGTDAQLIHVSRYIHLNPYSSKIVRSKESILSYPNSSMREYSSNALEKGGRFLVNTKKVLSQFNFNKRRYKKFVLSNAQHQATLEACKKTLEWSR